MYQVYHQPEDEAKITALIESMEADGWKGAPLVVDGDQLLTGMHRYEATRRLEWRWQDVPVIEIADVFEEAGLDYQAAMQEAGYDLVTALCELPEAVRDEYGIDIH
jgi:hypothetical protein